MSNEPESTQKFLTAEWRHLVMLNYSVERELLEPLVPTGTTLDTYKGNAYVTVVGFRFLKTRLLGIPVPFHQDFEEVNLRFYVRRFNGEEWRRGVVFIREIVPKAAVAFIARTFYNETYVSLPMRHEITSEKAGALTGASYDWESDGRWNRVSARIGGLARDPGAASVEEFITEHYWGYVTQKDGSVIEYQVEHPRWRVWTASESILDCDMVSMGGERFAKSLTGNPASAFVADGSYVTVFKGVTI